MRWRTIKPLNFIYNLFKTGENYQQFVNMLRIIGLVLICIVLIVSVYLNIQTISSPKIYTQKDMNNVIIKYENKIKAKDEYIKGLDDEIIDIRYYKETYIYSEHDVDEFLEEYNTIIEELENQIEKYRKERKRYIKG